MKLPAITVLGAGPAGLALSWLLARRGFQVTLLERAPHAGGNAASFTVAGHRVDYGSHRLHPSCPPEILADIRALLGDDLLERPRHGRIFLQNRWLHFPLQPLDIALHAPPAFAARVLTESVFKPRPEKSEETFASVLQRGLGPTICRDFYFPYARKIWGLDPVHIDAEQARRRVSAGTVSQLMRKVLAPPARRVFHYPRHGFGQICDAYAEAAAHAGVRILTHAAINAVETQPGRVLVLTSQGDLLESSLLLSTIPLPALARLMRPSAPAPVLDACSQLRYRAMLLVYLELPVPRFTEFDAHYFPGEDVRITRLSEPKNYSLHGPAGSTVLCAELPCSEDDPLWRLSDVELAKLVAEDLKRAQLPWPGRYSSVTVQRLRQAYPVYARGFQQHFAVIDHWLAAQPHVVTLGRQGLFAHDNTHHTLAMAYAAAACVRPAAAFDRDAWNQHRRRFEAFVVED